MKVLFTCVGRRVELIQAFREAAVNLGIDLRIIGMDATSTAPALWFCDEKMISPRISDPNYIPNLVHYCSENGVDAVIPTIDTDLLLLAENKNLFMNTRVVVSDVEKIQICRDKRLTGAFFGSAGVKFPVPSDNYKEYNQGFPAFIKPKDGSSSINAYKVESTEMLASLSERVPDYIVQPFIEGIEYTVDAFCDFDGNPILVTPRVRLAVRSGEVLKTQICLDQKIMSEMSSIISLFRPCGPITVQLIREKHSGDDYFIEINPRFGGGAPLSIKAGANSCEVLLGLLQGKKFGFLGSTAEDGAIFSRFDQSVRVY